MSSKAAVQEANQNDHELARDVQVVATNQKQIHKDSTTDGANLYNLLAQRKKQKISSRTCWFFWSGAPDAACTNGH